MTKRLQAEETVSSKGLNLKKKWRGEQREEETRMLCTLTFSKKVISGMGAISLFLVSREKALAMEGDWLH